MKKGGASKIEGVKEREKRYRSLFDNMLNGFALHEIVLDKNGKPTDYVFLEVNRSFVKLTGLPSNIVGKNVTKVMPGIKRDSTDWIGIYGKVAKTGKEIKFESYASTLKKWFSITAFSTEKGKFATIFEDITERKNVEIELEEIKELYQSTLQNLLVGVTIHDEKGGLLFGNMEASRILGLGAKKIKGKKLTDPAWKLVDEKGVALKVADYPASKALSSKKPITNCILGVNRPDRNYTTWINLNAIPILTKDKKMDRLIVNFVDITKKKKYEDELEQTSNEWESTFNAMPDLISIHDENSEIVRINKPFLDAFKMPKNKIIGQKCYKIVHGTDAVISECPAKKAMETGVSTTTEYYEPRLKLDMEITASPIIDKKGKFHGVVHIVRDISKRKKRENEIKEKTNELETFNSLAIDRELKMIELKKEISELSKKLNLPERYSA